MSRGESVAKSYSQENQNMAPSDVSMAHHPIFKSTHYSVVVLATPDTSAILITLLITTQSPSTFKTGEISSKG